MTEPCDDPRAVRLLEGAFATLREAGAEEQDLVDQVTTLTKEVLHLDEEQASLMIQSLVEQTPDPLRGVAWPFVMSAFGLGLVCARQARTSDELQSWFGLDSES